MPSNPITIEVLETLDAIDRRGSFAKAAEELNKATSAISYSIQKLEEQLNITVFQRQGRRSVLTPAGRLILLEGREVLQITNRIANKAKEVSTGWETRIVIAIESIQSYPVIFSVIQQFLEDHPTIEVDINECVLNGGWEALEHDLVDIVIGAPGPVPQQKGYRAIALKSSELIPVIATNHSLADLTRNKDMLNDMLPKIRKVIIHDTSKVEISRSEGLGSDGNIFYVQTIEQKLQAIVAGIGIGHMPRHRVQTLIDTGILSTLAIENTSNHDDFLVWKIANKGKGLNILVQKLIAMLGQ